MYSAEWRMLITCNVRRCVGT